MDRNNRPGGKYGQGMMMSTVEEKMTKKYRQKRLVYESIDLTKDPYFFKNHVGTFECRLCLTLHMNESSYILHSQGKKHQDNVGRQHERDEKAQHNNLEFLNQSVPKEKVRYVRIGNPDYKINVDEKEAAHPIIKIEVDYQGIITNQKPSFRLANPFEQKMEKPDQEFNYLLIAANPYNTICVKIPNAEDTEAFHIEPFWDSKTLKYILIIYY